MCNFYIFVIKMHLQFYITLFKWEYAYYTILHIGFIVFKIIIYGCLLMLAIVGGAKNAEINNKEFLARVAARG